jgi:hypothetical protein
MQYAFIHQVYIQCIEPCLSLHCAKWSNTFLRVNCRKKLQDKSSKRSLCKIIIEILKFNPNVLSIRTNSPFYRRTKAVLVFILCWLSAVLWWAKKKIAPTPSCSVFSKLGRKMGTFRMFCLLRVFGPTFRLWFHTKLSSLLGQAAQHAVVGWCSLKLPWQIGLNTRAGGRDSTYTQNKCCTCNVHYLGTYVAG